MNTPSVIIESAGLLTTVQDRGRYGYQRYGMPVSGAMDVFSLELANMLVGNDPGAACIEATVYGPEMLLTGDTIVAVTGADMGLTVNGKSAAMNRAISIRKGDRLAFNGLRYGCRSYIAFAGGIDVPMVMGSRSTYLRAATGGHEGRALRAGDELPLGMTGNNGRIRDIPEGLIPGYSHSQTIRITTGPEAHFFNISGIRNFLATEYMVTAQSDRMGYRLSGEPVTRREGKGDIISAGISQGTIQVPGDGQPIILMADRQTSGGYARIACVTSVDLTLVAQLIPGDTLRFKEISLEKAQELLKERQKLIISASSYPSKA